MQKRILCVDDEPNVLQAFERQFRKRFEIRTALGPEAGLRALVEHGPFAVVVSDLRMPGMSGVEFLSRVRQSSPDTVRVMLTGQADLNAAIASVNEGNIFRFLTKPCPAETLARTLEAALEQYRLITAERELLEETLRGSVGVLCEILSLVNPPAFSRAQRIRRYVQHIAWKLNFQDDWQYELAAMLSQIGCVTVPSEVLEKVYVSAALSPKEQEILASQIQVGYKLLAKIPRLEVVAQMIANQRNPWGNRTETTDPAAVGGNLLKVALDFDEQTMRGAEVTAVLGRMSAHRDYNPAFVAALLEVQVQEAESEIRLVPLSAVQVGMIINVDVKSKNGLLLLAKGQEVTDSAIARLQSFALTIGIVEPLSVRTPQTKTDEGAPVSELTGASR